MQSEARLRTKLWRVKRGENYINIVFWIVFCAFAGWLASIIMRTDARQGWLMNVILGIIGAMVGGFIMNLLGAPGVTGFDIYSLLVSIVGAVVLIWLGRFLYR